MSDTDGIKVLGRSIGRVLRGKVPKDGDGDGMYTNPVTGEDNIPVAVAVDMVRDMVRDYKGPKIQVSREKIDMIGEVLRAGFGGGFTVTPLSGTHLTSGIAVARRGQGLIFEVKKGQQDKTQNTFDENGYPSEELINTTLAFLDYHGAEVFNNPKPGARRVALGGWLNGDLFFLDVSDVYDETPENMARARELGDREDQISVAVLSEITRAVREDQRIRAEWKQQGKEGEPDTSSVDWSKTGIYMEERPGLGMQALPTEAFKLLTELYARIERDGEKRRSRAAKNRESASQRVLNRRFKERLRREGLDRITAGSVSVKPGPIGSYVPEPKESR